MRIVVGLFTLIFTFNLSAFLTPNPYGVECLKSFFNEYCEGTLAFTKNGNPVIIRGSKPFQNRVGDLKKSYDKKALFVSSLGSSYLFQLRPGDLYKNREGSSSKAKAVGSQLLTKEELNSLTPGDLLSLYNDDHIKQIFEKVWNQKMRSNPDILNSIPESFKISILQRFGPGVIQVFSPENINGLAKNNYLKYLSSYQVGLFTPEQVKKFSAEIYSKFLSSQYQYLRTTNRDKVDFKRLNNLREFKQYPNHLKRQLPSSFIQNLDPNILKSLSNQEFMEYFSQDQLSMITAEQRKNINPSILSNFPPPKDFKSNQFRSSVYDAFKKQYNKQLDIAGTYQNLKRFLQARKDGGFKVVFAEHTFEVPPGRITLKEAQEILDKMMSEYAKELRTVKTMNRVITQSWFDNTFNADSGIDNDLQIKVYGGLVRAKNMTGDALYVTMCHEVGHILGGAPIKFPGASLLASEGQSDYFATSKCLKRIFKNDNNLEIIKKLNAPDALKQKCASVYSSNTNSYAICVRSGVAAEILINVFVAEDSKSMFGRINPVTVNAYDQKVVPQTFTTGYPGYQCRLDTLVAGALCKSIDPYSKADNDRDIANGCDSGIGARPACWFKLGSPIKYYDRREGNQIYPRN